MQISLGAGQLRKPGEWTYVDILALPGIDVVHDLNIFPWPFADGSAEYIEALDVLEHVNDPIAFINECGRILQPHGAVYIQTPRFDAEFLWIDPSHKRGFHEQSMDFWDPDTEFGKTTGFYATTKFVVKSQVLPNKNLRFVMVKR
jgi:predicted SAM-dependent methyltransferase